MILDLEDQQLRAQLRQLPGKRTRLVLEYPEQPRYRNAVMGALAYLFRSASGDAEDERAEARR